MNVGRKMCRPGQTGLTLIEHAIIMVVAGQLLVPLIGITGSAVASNCAKSTQSALDTASEALVSFAAANGGCLPYAADDEGGLPDTDASVRTLYELPAGETLDTGVHPVAEASEFTDHLPDPLLQVRRGPDVTGAAPQSDVISSQNVFVLIAPGDNLNTSLSRRYIRDSTHKKASGFNVEPVCEDC